MASRLNNTIQYIITGSSSFIIPFIIFICATIYFVWPSTFSLYDFPLDDAWINRVYSRSFAFGHGFQYNSGTQEAGSTSPLWAIITAPAHWLEPFGARAVVVGVKIIGVILGLTSLVVIQKISGVLTGSQKIGVIAASFFAIEPRFLFSVFSGMETTLLVTLWLSASYAFIVQRWLFSFILFSMTPVTRPEALVILPLCILGLLIIFVGRRGSISTQPIIWIVPWLPMLLWSGFCKYTNGHWLPNTFYLKARPFHLDWHEISVAWQAVSQHGFASLLIFFIGMGAYLAWIFVRRDFISKSSLLFLIIAPVIYLIGVVSTRRVILDGYYWTRWVDPASLLLTIPFCIGYSIILMVSIDFQKLIVTTLPRTFKNYQILFVFFTWCGLAGLIYSSPLFAKSFFDRRTHLASDSRATHLINVQTGQWIKENTPLSATIGVNDAGAIRYFGKRRTIDLLGLNSADIAFGKIRFDAIFYEIEWLAIFPLWFEGNMTNFIEKHFEKRKVFHIPLEEYTICNCPSQTTKVIYKKKKSTNSSLINDLTVVQEFSE